MNVINIIVGLLIGLAHVYLPLPTLLGFTLGCLMTISGTYIIAVSYFFTANSTNDNDQGQKQELDSKLINSIKSNLFITISIPMLFLNAGSSFFGFYTGMALLLPALTLVGALPVISPALLLGISITFGIIFAASTLINSWLQIHSLWNKMRTPKKEKAIVTDDADTKKINQVLKQNTLAPRMVLVTSPTMITEIAPTTPLLKQNNDDKFPLTTLTNRMR